MTTFRTRNLTFDAALLPRKESKSQLASVAFHRHIALRGYLKPSTANPRVICLAALTVCS